MTDHRVLAPIGCLRVGAAIGLEVQDLDFPPGNLCPTDPEIVIFPGELKRRTAIDDWMPLRKPAAWQEHPEN
jgi:hypothetical protein